MDNFRWHRLVAVTALLALALTPAAIAQRPTGDLNVVCMDNQGAKLPGVTVTVTGQGADKIQVTNAQGRAFFPGLDPASLQMSAVLEGFSTVEYPSVVISANRTTTIEVTMTPAVEEVITVTSESPLLDEKRISSGTTISQIELESIPTARDPWSVLNQTQGVMVDRVNVGGNESGQQSSFTAPGVSDDENSFLVDGVEITDMAAVGSSATYYDFDQFTEMQFGTGGADVTKSAAGVSVNLITKRGTNEFRGSARFLRTDDNMFDTFTQTTPVKTTGNGDLGAIPGREQTSFIGNSINQVTEYGFEAGGPVLRDKLWFWGSFGTNDIRNRTGGRTLAQVQSDDTVLENTSFKVNAQISGSNSALGSWNNGNKLKFGRNAGPTRPQPTTWDQRGPSAVIRFEDTHVFSSNFFLTGTYGKVDGGFQLISKAVIANGGDFAATPETTWDANGVWGESYLSGGSSRPSEEFKIDGSYFFNTGNVSHELKFGTRLRDFETESPFHWPGRDVFHVDLQLFGVPDPLDWVIAHRGETPLTTQEYTSVWAQDTISSGNWTVNAGFRYDLQEGNNEAFTVPGNPAFPTLLPSLSFNGEAAPFDWETISPRIGVTYALGEERKTLLRGSYSQFPEQLSSGNVSRLNPLSDSYATFLFEDGDGDNAWLNPGPDGVFGTADDVDVLLGLSSWSGFDPNNPTALTNPNQTDPNLDPAITDEILLSVEHSFLPEFVMGVNVTWRNTGDVLETRTLIEDPVTGIVRTATAADYVVDGIVSGTLPGGGSYSEPVYALACGSSCKTGGSRLINGDREQEYQGFGVTFTKRLSNRWMARGYVNFGETEWNVPASYTANQDPTDFEGGFDNDGGLFAVQAAGSGAKQDVFIQSSWQWNLNGLYQVAPDRPWGFNVAANLFGREGTPLPYYHRTRRSDGTSRDVQVTTDIDSFRSDDILTTDIRLEKEFAATGNVGFTVSLDAFNLFDEDYVLQRRRQLNTGNADWLTESLSPRIFRIGVRLNWR